MTIEPEIEERFDPDRTILTLSFAKKQAKKTKENIEMIKKYLEEHGESKTNDIAEHINLSPARTRALSSFRRRITERVKKGISGNGSCTTRQRIETLLVNGVDIKTGVSHKKYDLRLFLFAERK